MHSNTEEPTDIVMEVVVVDLHIHTVFIMRVVSEWSFERLVRISS